MVDITQAQQAVDELIIAAYAQQAQQGASGATALRETAKYVGVTQAKVRAVIEATTAAAKFEVLRQMTQNWERDEPLRVFGLGLKELIDALAVGWAADPERRTEAVEGIRYRKWDFSDKNEDFFEDSTYPDYEPTADEILTWLQDMMWETAIADMADASQRGWGPWWPGEG